MRESVEKSVEDVYGCAQLCFRWQWLSVIVMDGGVEEGRCINHEGEVGIMAVSTDEVIPSARVWRECWCEVQGIMIGRTGLCAV